MSLDLSFLLLTQVLLPALSQSLLDNFLIVCLEFCTKILKVCFSPYQIFRKLSLVPKRFDMSEWCFVEHKEICYFMFL